MNTENRPRPAWVGFLVGLLVVVLPVGGYLAYKEYSGRRSATPPRPTTTATGTPSAPTLPVFEPYRIDAAEAPVAGASLPDRGPPLARSEWVDALRRAESWLARVTTDPYAGIGTDSLRLFALEVQCWDRLRLAAETSSRRTEVEGQIQSRLRRLLDVDRLDARLQEQGNLYGALELMILASLCRESSIDPAPILERLEPVAPAIIQSMPQMPTGIAAIYSAQLTSLGIGAGLSLETLRHRGALVRQPREVQMSAADATGLTQEIFAYSDSGRRPLKDLSSSEATYLHRVLPQLALTSAMLRTTELCADLVSALALVGMTETYGYREGLRFLVTRQNEDGSFGDPSVPRSARYATVVACLTALSLESLRQQGGM